MLTYQFFSNGDVDSRGHMPKDDFNRQFRPICKAWGSYLKHYADVTKGLFGTGEYPWMLNERALVSTLAIAICRKFKDAVVIEELPVSKKASGPKTTNSGRADLWCSRPNEDRRFNFYLEAKRTIKPRQSLDKLRGAFSDRLISRGFRDFQKSAGKSEDGRRRVTKSSPYKNIPLRKHDHIFVELMVATFSNLEPKPKELKRDMVEFFSNIEPLLVKVTDNKNIRRRLGRFPIAGVVMSQVSNGKLTGFVAAFMMLGTASRTGNLVKRIEV